MKKDKNQSPTSNPYTSLLIALMTVFQFFVGLYPRLYVPRCKHLSVFSQCLMSVFPRIKPQSKDLSVRGLLREHFHEQPVRTLESRTDKG